MKNAKHTAALLSISAFALVLMGVGCEGFLKSDTDIMVDDDLMMEESDKIGDTMMAGDAMNEDNNMVDGDAMVDTDAEVMLEDDAMVEGNMEADEMMEKDGDSMMEKDDAMMEQSAAGTFEAYSEDKLSRANEGTVVLAFLADWCPTCRALKSDINANLGDIPTGLSILEINYDNASALKQQYGVTYQHTFVEVDAEGNMIQKWSGGNTLESITEKVS